MNQPTTNTSPQKRKPKPWLFLIVVLAVLPILAILKQTPQNDIQWRTDYKSAKIEAETDGKPLMLYFSASWCDFCRNLARDVWPDSRIEKILNESYIPLNIDMNDKKQDPVAQKFNVSLTPTIIIFSRHGREIIRLEGPRNAEQLLEILEDALENERQSNM